MCFRQSHPLKLQKWTEYSIGPQLHCQASFLTICRLLNSLLYSFTRCCNTDVDCKKITEESLLSLWGSDDQLQTDAELTLESQDFFPRAGRNSPQFKQTSFVSQHWTTHYSTQMQPQPWNKASLPCGTVPLYCHCSLYYIVAHEWALLSYLMMEFSNVDTWDQK